MNAKPEEEVKSTKLPEQESGKHVASFTAEREETNKNYSDANFWGTESQAKAKTVDELLGELSD